ncbi:FG-GAP repeat domain-containing protein [Nocardia concava]|uniref:FG-GAP repeat domain-containing protein n=1 Tax=Nocardia concava TaxID=257281 RepID=UPI0002EC3705|nr:VCBS repeat-containing protein [Nocardia concava]
MSSNPDSYRRVAALAVFITALTVSASLTPTAAEQPAISFLPQGRVPGGLFAPDSVYGGNPVAAADFSGTGRRDLVLANCLGSGPLIAHGNGDGTFGPPTLIDIGRDACTVTAADVNGDGIPDILTGSWATDQVSVILSRPDGTFTPPSNFTINGYPPMKISVADFDCDGRADFAVHGNLPGTVTIFRGTGDGAFAPAGAPLYAVGFGIAMSMAVADLNHDGFPDLVVGEAHPLGPIQGDYLRVFLNNGDATFRFADAYRVGWSPEQIQITDLDGNGRPDIIVGDANSNDVTILYGTGDGAFSAATTKIHGPGLIDGNPAVQVADFDNDGRPDLAIVETVTSRVLLYHNEGNRNFVAAGEVPIGDPVPLLNLPLTLPQEFLATDLTGDGYPDLAVPTWLPSGSPTNIAIHIFRNTAPGSRP